ncbi:MAG: hypothetical protein EOO51_12570 [Flavobacterium sp.]|nr:MAG: hypothetical protein EOO51_12570 [Flavobacterium sp.]
MSNLYDSYQANNLDGIIIFSLVSDTIVIDFNPPGEYGYTVFTAQFGFSPAIEEYTPDPVLIIDELQPLDVNDICIQIIDTYDNDRLFNVELTEKAYAKMTWDGGDDMYSALMVAKLVFNMWVPDASDGHFFHLFTGDEKRYKVKLWTVDADETFDLIWQGFLLPDFYEEPYTNGGFFVGFTAVDMVGAMKGKFLKPWFYNNRFPIAKLLSYCLAETGLEQQIIVAPSLIPNNDFWKWKDICVSLSHYVSSGKYTDVYQILIDVLEANGLTMYSFRGYWFIVGITRKKDEVLTGCFVFNTTGDPIGILDVYKKVSTPLMAKGTPHITAFTPWKAVNLNYDIKGSKNLFPDDIVNKPWFGSHYLINQFLLGNGIGTTPNDDYYRTSFFGYWTKVNAPLLDLNRFNENRLNYRAFNSPSYSCTESAALANYFECSEQPYLKAGTAYEIEMEMVASLSVDNFTDFSEKLKNGALDKLFAFQMLHNGDEILTNRPSVGMSADIRYATSFSQNGAITYATFKLKYEFKTEFSGKVIFRILSPIVTSFSSMSINSFTRMVSNVLKINVLDDYDFTESTRAVRDINFTKEYENTVKFGCSQDISIKNSFGLNYPITDQYFWDIPVGVFGLIPPFVFADKHFFAPDVDLDFFLYTWGIDQNTFNLLFKSDWQKCVFVESATGEQRALKSLYANQMGAAYRMGFLSDFEGQCVIPKDYKKEPALASDDEVKYMRVWYPFEDIDSRGNWIIWGADGSTENTFARTLANAIHYVRPETIYSLESTFLQSILPNELIQFTYYGQTRNFIPTRLELDLTLGKTTAKTEEAKYADDIDITYE